MTKCERCGKGMNRTSKRVYIRETTPIHQRCATEHEIANSERETVAWRARIRKTLGMDGAA